jgi:hypothetical protein
LALNLPVECQNKVSQSGVFVSKVCSVGVMERPDQIRDPRTPFLNRGMQRRRQGGDVAGALTEFAARLTKQQRVLGADHPATLSTRNNLVTWRGRGGDIGNCSSV